MLFFGKFRNPWGMSVPKSQRSPNWAVHAARQRLVIQPDRLDSKGWPRALWWLGDSAGLVCKAAYIRPKRLAGALLRVHSLTRSQAYRVDITTEAVFGPDGRIPAADLMDPWASIHPAFAPTTEEVAMAYLVWHENIRRTVLRRLAESELGLLKARMRIPDHRAIRQQMASRPEIIDRLDA